MGFALEIGVEIRKSVTTSMGTCYRSLCNHPFLVAFLLFLTFLHRFFPYVFSTLVTASPVLVCSVILLGTLLIFGQPKLPETEREKKITHDFASLRTWVSGDDTVISERDRSFSIDKFSGKMKDAVDMSLEEVSCSRFSSDQEGSIGYVPLIDETFQHTQSEKRDLDSKEQENQRIIHKENFWIDSIIRDVEAIEKPASHKGDHSESSMGGGGGDDEASDSGSDRAVSLSPDASIEDILPILDELHPLLDLDAPLPAHMSHDDSGVGSDRSNDDSNVSDDEGAEIRGGEVEEDEIDDNDCNEEEAQDGKEDESKSAIKWTEDDQMNLRDLGNLELERNQCLENLITRRRASKSFSLAAEKNLIDFDSAVNPFNITTISTTRHNPFDLSHDRYDDMGLPPIPGSAPSTFLPRRNPFDIPYEPNEENPELKGDRVEQECATVSSTTFFCRHESFSLGPSRLGDAKQERQDLKWGPVFVPEQLPSEGTSFCSYQRLPSAPSDSKLSSIPESVSSGEDLDERKFSERDITKEAEVISNIYQASDLVDHRTRSFEDLDYLEMEWPGKKDVQHDEPEIKLGEVESGNASLSSTGGWNIPGEHITSETHLKPEPFEEKTSNRSSMSSLSDEDEKCSDLRKDRSKFLEPFDTEVQTVTGMVDDIQHKEPVYDSSPPGSEKVLSFNSISSDIQAEISEVVTFPSSAETHVPFADSLDSDFHIKSIEKGTSGNEEIGATTKVHGALENERGSGECNRLFLTSSHSDEHVDLPKNLNVKASSPDSSPQYVYLKDKTQAEQEKNLFLSDISVVDPCFDDHNARPEPPIILSETKEDSSIIKDMNAQGAREVEDPGLKNLFPVTAKSTSTKVIASKIQETISTHTALDQISEANELPKPSNSKDGSTEIGTNAVDSTKEIASSNTRTNIQEIVTTHTASKQFSEANVGDQPKPSNSKDRSSKVETSTMGSPKENGSSDAETGVEKPVTTNSPKKVSEANDCDLLKPSNPKDGSTELGTNTNSPKKVSEANDCELPKPSNSKDGSTELGTNAVGSTKEISSINIGTGVQVTVTTHTAPKEVLEDNVGVLPKLSNSKDGLTEVGTNTVVSTKDIALSNIGSGVQETATAVKQVSESDLSKLPTLSSSKDELAKVATNGAVGSTTSLQETVPTPPKQVSIGDLNELPISSNSKNELAKVATSDAIGSTTRLQETVPTPNPVCKGDLNELPKSSNSKDGLNKVETNAVGSAKEIASNTPLGTSVPETVSTPTPMKQLSEVNVADLPKPLNSKDGYKEIETNAVSSTKEIASKNTWSDVQEKGTTTQKQVSGGIFSELLKTSNSEDGSLEVATNNAAGSTNSVQETVTTPLKQVSEGNCSELPKPSNSNGGSTEVGANAAGSTTSVQETATTPLTQVSEGNVSELPKSSNTKDGSPDVTNVVHCTQSVQDTKTVQQVSEANVGELPKPSNSKDGSTELGTNAVDSTKKLALSNMGTSVQEGIATHIAKQVSEGNLSELPTPSHLNDGSADVGTKAVGSTKSVQETVTTLKQISEGNINELPKPLDLKDGSTEVPNTVSSTKSVQETIQEVSEGNVVEIPKPSKDGSTEVGTTVMDSSKKLASSDVKGTSVQDGITSHTEKKVAEGSVGELLNPSNLKDELPKVGVDAVGSTQEIPSSNIESGAQKSITTSEGDVAEFPRPSNSEEGHVSEVPKPSISEESNAGDSPKPTNPKESDGGDAQKPPNSKGWLWW